MEIPPSSQYPSDLASNRTGRDLNFTRNRMSLSYLILRYGLCVLSFLIGSTLLIAAGAILILPILYVCFGVFMSRTLERVVIWNEHLASLSDIARVKRSVWIGWLYGIPRLVWDIWVVERM